MAYKADDEPYEVGPHEGRVTHKQKQLRAKLMQRIKRKCREGALLPADAETARVCQVPWVEPERLPSGEWEVKGHVKGWTDWPKRSPEKFAADVSASRNAAAFAAANGPVADRAEVTNG